MMQLPRNWWKQIVTAVKVWINWRSSNPIEAPILIDNIQEKADEHETAAPIEGHEAAASDPCPPSEDRTEIQAPNRATRRAQSREWRRYEKQRRKFDKFVTPQGTPPTPIERTIDPDPKPKSLPKTPEPEYTDDGYNFIIDKHHTDRSTKVLFDVREVWGEFNFRDTILEQLERYFVYLARMEKHDKESYEFYGHVGAQLAPYAGIADIWKTDWNKKGTEYTEYEKPSAWFLKHRPAFGCVAYGTAPEIEKIERGEYFKGGESGKNKGKWLLIPKFMYFTKYMDRNAPPEVQPKSGGDVYKMTIWWDRTDAKKFKHGRPEEFPVFVGADGRVEILRMISTEMFPVYNKKYGLDHIPQRAWRLPHHADDWAKQHHTDAKKLINNLFCGLANRLEHSAFSMIRVSVANDKGQHALFSIDPHRMAYFFQDRDYQLTESGQRKRIFHMVSPHVRADGAVVRLHFRGVREFTWAGYKVRITVPGKDHLMMEEVDFGVQDEFWVKDERDAIPEGEIGRLFRSYIDGKPIKVEDLKTFRPKKEKA